MDACTDPYVEEVTVVKCARIGGTQAAIDNPIGYWIHNDPGPILVVQAGKDGAETWAKGHFDSMVRDTEVLRRLVHTDKLKDRRNRINYKKFPGGELHIIGSNSAAGFRLKTIQRALLDDVDGYDLSAGSEGDQIELARMRTLTYTFHHRKIIKVSTPTTRGLSRIKAEYDRSTMEHYFVPCPFCATLQFLAWSQRSEYEHLAGSFLRYDSATGQNIYYECEHCRKPIDERYKLQMIAGGRWIAERPQVVNHRGFQLNELVSPFTSWQDMVKNFLEAKGLRDKLRVFVNQRLGETFIEDTLHEVKDDELQRRVEDYKNVPEGVLTITTQVDVQGDRLEVLTTGWGAGARGWHIDHRVLPGSPEMDAVWEELTRYLNRSWIHASGLELKPWTMHGLSLVAIDSSYQSSHVYRYVKEHQKQWRIFATKGREGFDKPFVITQPKLEARYRARFVTLGVDSIKVHLFDRLSRSKDKDGNAPPGYLHFNKQCDADYFKQLTAEVRKPVRDRRTGATHWRWFKKEGVRNEVLDLWTYGIAALTLLDPDFDALEKKLKEKIAALKPADVPPTERDFEETDEPQQHPRRPKRGRRGRGDTWATRI
jgi:phage terminase large subunit GpA-like protein